MLSTFFALLDNSGGVLYSMFFTGYATSTCPTRTLLLNDINHASFTSFIRLRLSLLYNKSFIFKHHSPSQFTRLFEPVSVACSVHAYLLAQVTIINAYVSNTRHLFNVVLAVRYSSPQVRFVCSLILAFITDISMPLSFTALQSMKSRDRGGCHAPPMLERTYTVRTLCSRGTVHHGHYVLIIMAPLSRTFWFWFCQGS